MKTCTKCLEHKELQEYYHRKDGSIEAQCKKCKIIQNQSIKRLKLIDKYKKQEISKAKYECYEVCIKCGVRLSIENTSKGREHFCKECYRESQQPRRAQKQKTSKVYYNTEKGKENSRKHHIKNREKYYPYRKEWQDKKYKEDPLFKLRCNLRHRTKEALKDKKYTKSKSLDEYLGCSIAELKIYIESKFKPGMNWEERNKWHLDHKTPLSSARTVEELYKLCHYTNLQPLWAYDNLSKGAKIV